MFLLKKSKKKHLANERSGYGFILFALLIITTQITAQPVAKSFSNTEMNYTIINKNDSVGNMKIRKKISGDDIFYSVASIVEMRFLMLIKVVIREESFYQKGRMISSTSKRFINDKLKGNKETKADGELYILTDDDKKSRMSEREISYNFGKLYFAEPVNIKEIYSDYYQKYVSIQTKEPHVYQIDLPEGGSNTYHYVNGICTSIDLHGTFFNGQMILNHN